LFHFLYIYDYNKQIQNQSKVIKNSHFNQLQLYTVYTNKLVLAIVSEVLSMTTNEKFCVHHYTSSNYSTVKAQYNEEMIDTL